MYCGRHCRHLLKLSQVCIYNDVKRFFKHDPDIIRRINVRICSGLHEMGVHQNINLPAAGILCTVRALGVTLATYLLLGVGRREQALRTLEWHLRRGPKSVRCDAFLCVLSGIILKNVGDTRASLARIEEAIKIAPKWFYARMWAAEVAYRAKSYEKAVEHLQELVELHHMRCRSSSPSKVMAHYYAMLGYSVSQLGQSQRAMELYKKALEVDPSNEEIRRRYEIVEGNSGTDHDLG